jgi:putative ABC transport system permease protein
MIRNYFKIALRHLQKNKLYAFVNILGLATGITSCILIGIFIWHELSYDRFHKNAGRIVRATWEYNFGDKPEKTALTGTRVGPEFKRAFPEVESYIRTLKYPRVIAYKDKLFDEKKFFYADSAFFSMFSFPLISGDPEKVLDAPDKMVITQTMAKKYFGNENPIGQTVKVGVKDFTISGIAADAPDNSQIQFDFVGSFTSLNAAKTEKWNEANYITYLLLRSKVQLKALQAKADNYIGALAKKEMKLESHSYSKYWLEPLTAVHLHSGLDGFEPNGNIVYIYVLAAVALLILLIACVNYTNLSTAQSAGRSAEVGMRKVLGARSKQVFLQFISESFLLTVFSILLAIGLSVFLLPYFNQLSGKSIHTSVLFAPRVVIGLLILAFVVALSAGTYPSLILSQGRIIHILKSGFRFTGSGGLRKSLIVFQFVISIFLIISTIIILQQLSYIRHKDLGYDKEQVIVLPVDNVIIQKYDDIKKALAGNANIKSIAGAYEEPTNIGWSDGMNTGTEHDESRSIFINAIPVDEDFIKTLNLKIIAGSDYTQADVQQFDTSNGGNNLHYVYILNESAVKALGWTPEEAIGKMVTKGISGPVKAVVKDFHFRSFHEAIGPLVIFLDKRMMGSMFVKVSGNIPAALNYLEKTWKQRITHRPFEYHFLDEDYDSLYRAEQRTGGVFSAFAGIAIILACLGLFALTAYAMVQRTKEIGIRKVLGATLPGLLTLVSKEFIKLVFIAFVLATPVAWYAVHKWLGNFAYKVPIHWWVFIVAGSATLVIAFITISLQAIRTAMMNPVKSLRSE